MHVHVGEVILNRILTRPSVKDFILTLAGADQIGQHADEREARRPGRQFARGSASATTEQTPRREGPHRHQQKAPSRVHINNV